MGAEKKRRIDLGLALLALANQPSAPLTCEEIAAWCGCRKQNIQQIESRRGLRRLRNRVTFLKDERLREAAEQVLGKRVTLL